MNDQARRARSYTRIEREAALRRIKAAAQLVSSDDTQTSRDALWKAVDAARQLGIGWTMIGDTLGIASGNAYKRYRKPPTSPDGRSTRRRGPASGCEEG